MVFFLYPRCIAGDFTRLNRPKLGLCAVNLVFCLHNVLLARDDKTVILSWLLFASSFYPVVQYSPVLE